ncbi:hypothetical protein OG389_32680 [Streptomyces sp. NBC_00435]|uniref:hypothetical protein n=1 Tax=Streptomyces sp. NBC_00435 TaxID=2903649 RepID=UPI002E230CF3
MRRRAGAATVISAAAVLAAAAAVPSAADQGRNITSFGFDVSPSSVAPGGRVTLSATGCEVPSVKVTSGIFDDTVLEEGRPATVSIDHEARPGAQYQVTFDCKGEKGTTTLTVSAGRHRGVKAGEGATAVSPGGWTGTGAVLLSAGLLGGFYVMRRKSRNGA